MTRTPTDAIVTSGQDLIGHILTSIVIRLTSTTHSYALMINGY